MTGHVSIDRANSWELFEFLTPISCSTVAIYGGNYTTTEKFGEIFINGEAALNNGVNEWTTANSYATPNIVPVPSGSLSSIKMSTFEGNTRGIGVKSILCRRRFNYRMFKIMVRSLLVIGDSIIHIISKERRRSPTDHHR